MSLNFVMSPVGVWEVDKGSVVTRVGEGDVSEVVEAAYVLLRGLELLGSVVGLMISFDCS